MVSIDIDFDVFKELTIRRESEAMTENEVLRELLGLTISKSNQQPSSPNGIPWVVKGVTFPSGTEFKATHKGRNFEAQVKNGALVLNGKRYKSPSAAAVSITGNPVNGWRFWECKLPNSSSWQLAAKLRA